MAMQGMFLQIKSLEMQCKLNLQIFNETAQKDDEQNMKFSTIMLAEEKTNDFVYAFFMNISTTQTCGIIKCGKSFFCFVF